MSSGGNPKCVVWYGKQPCQEPTCQTHGMTKPCSAVSMKVNRVYKDENLQMID